MRVVKKLAIIIDESLLKSTSDLKSFHEKYVLADLKRLGHKFIEWEWIRGHTTVPHLALFVTYEERKKLQR